MIIEGWTGRYCECHEWKRARRLLERSGIAEDFRKITFDDYKTEGKHPLFAKAKRIAMQYAEQYKDIKDTKKNGLGLCGEPGSGKTTLLLAVANHILSQRLPVLYFQHREEFDRIKAFNFHDADEVYERVKTFPGLVVWDDLLKTTQRDEQGNRKIAPWEADATWTIINYRIFKDLPLAFSTEWTPAQLVNFDRSLAGRLIERAHDRVVTFRLTREEVEAGMDPITTFDHRFMRRED